MKRTLFFITLLFVVLLCRTPTEAALTYGAEYYRTHKYNVGAGTAANDPIWLHFDAVDDLQAGSGGFAAILYTPGTAPSSPVEGQVWYDSSSNGLVLRNNSASVPIDTAGGSSLDVAYGLGSAIDVDTLAIIMTTSSGDGNRVLELVQNDTSGNPNAMLITNSGTGIGLTFATTGTYDARGTSNLWSLAADGTVTGVAVVVGASDLTFENGGVINNTTDNEIEFIENGEEFSFAFNGNTLTFATDTGIDTIDWGALTTASGMTTITGDDADFTIGSTGTTTGFDVIIQQAGTGDNQLVLQSAGSATNALRLLASAAGIDLDAVGSTIVMTNTADGGDDDFTIEVDGDQDASLILQSDGTGGDALSLITSAATGDLKIASADTIDFDSVDHMTFDLSAAESNFDVDAAGGSVYLDGGEAAANAIVIVASNAAGGIDADAGTAGIAVDTTGAFSIDGAAASNVSVVSASVDENLTVSVTGATASSLILSSAGTGTDAVDLNAIAGGIDIDSALDVAVDLSGAGSNFDVDSAAGSVFLDAGEADAAAVTIIASATAGGIDVDSGTGGITVDSTGVISIDGADDMNFTLTTSTDGEDLSIIVDGDDNASIFLDSDGTGVDAISIQASNVVGGIDVDAGTYGINMDATGGDITVTNTGDKDIVIDAQAGQVLITGTLSGADSILLTADGANGEIALASKVGGIDMDAVGGPITVDNTGAGMDIHIDSSAGEAHLIGGQANATAITIDAEHTDGGIDMDAGTAGFNLTVTAGDLTVTNTGAKDIIIDAQAGRVLISGTESAANAIHLYADGAAGEIYLQAKTGGIDMDAASGDITLDTTGAAGDLITLTNTTGTGAAAIGLVATAGAVSIDGGITGAAAVVIIASHTDGGIDVDAGTSGINIKATGGDIKLENTTAKDIILDATAGRVLITGTESAANAIHLYADGVAGEIYLQANTGGIDMDAASGDITLDTTGAVGDLITLTNATGTGASAIGLVASAGGITAKVVDGASLKLGNTALNSYFEVAAHGTPATEYVKVVNSAGTATNAVYVQAAAGWVDIDAFEGFTVDVAGGTAASADIILTNTPGTATDAIYLNAVAGGMKLHVVDEKALVMGHIGDDTYVSIAPSATPATELIKILNTAGTAVAEDGAAIQLSSLAGGISIQSDGDLDDAITIRADGGTTAEILIHNDRGTSATSIEIVSDDGGISMTAAKALKIEAALAVNNVQTFAQSDATPDVGGFNYFNTGTAADTIDDFDGAIVEGQLLIVISKAVITYDVDAGALVAGTTDIITGVGDSTMWVYDGTNWVLLSWMNDAADQNAGNGG